jgi:anti-sigma-K factor RskA
MSTRDPRVRETLAGEYVLGTLHGLARQRFERWLREDEHLRQLVEEWERHLHPLAESLPPVEPPARVWRALKRQIQPLRERRRLWDDLLFWRTVGLTASALAMALLLYIGLASQPFAPGPNYIVVLNNPQGQPAWLVSAEVRTGRLIIKTVRPQRLPADKAFELWMLPGGNQPPRSLGLIPVSGRRSVTLPPPSTKVLTGAQGLAVSLEPTGGSPTGLPTGPVLYQGPLLSL